jgi:hypothetical protein
MCAAWTTTSGSLLDGNSDITISVVQNGTADYLAVTSTVGGAASCVPAAFGQLTLGEVVASTTTFVGNGNNASSLQWDGATLTLTIRLGSGSAPAPPGPLTYANTTVKDQFGRTLANSPFTAVGGAF